MPSQPGPYPLPGISMESWVVRFDESGRCVSPKTRSALLAKLAAEPGRPVIFFSHGWNNDFSDAVDLYRRFLVNFEAATAANPLPAGTKPIFVGITWPSIWLPSDSGPQLAAAPEDESTYARDEALLAELRRILPSTTDWNRLYELLEADRVSGEDAKVLARLIAPALRAGFEEGASEPATTEEHVLRAMSRLQSANARRKGYYLGESGTISGGSPAAPAAPAGALDFLDPRNALRLASLYMMKDRAGTVGAAGVSEFLRAMLSGSSSPVYAIGHSFGCKVMMSAVCAAPLDRKLKAILLLQPAISYLSFAANIPGVGLPGGYRSGLDRVEGPICVTYSGNDFPLHTIYHLALMREKDIGELKVAGGTSAGEPPNIFAALGGFGPRNSSEALIDPIPQPNESFAFPPGARIIGLDGTREKRIDSHGGVATPATAWMLHRLMN